VLQCRPLPICKEDSSPVKRLVSEWSLKGDISSKNFLQLLFGAHNPGTAVSKTKVQLQCCIRLPKLHESIPLSFSGIDFEVTRRHVLSTFTGDHTHFKKSVWLFASRKSIFMIDMLPRSEGSIRGTSASALSFCTSNRISLTTSFLQQCLPGRTYKLNL